MLPSPHPVYPTQPRTTEVYLAFFTRMDSLGVDSSKRHNQVSSKGFLTTGPRIKAGNVVIHMGLYTPMPGCPVYCSCIGGLRCELELQICASFGITRLICASFGITRLICASFEITRLIGVSFGITRLIRVSFGITRLIRASFGIIRLIRVRVQRGADRRGARRMREGHMDASGFLYASADVFILTYDVSLCFVSLWLKRSLPLVREMQLRRGARRGGRGGRGREAGRVQPEVQPVTQATDPAAPVTHADLAAMEQKFRDLIMQMREQQQPAPPAPSPNPVVPQVVLDQLSAEAKHLRDFRKYNPTTFDGSLEDPTRAQLWLSSLETIFRYMKCPEDQKVQCAVFMLTDKGTTWWETTERMLGGDVGQITWQQFKESFYAKFFFASLRDAKRQEFLNLEQDDMTIVQYDVEFDMLSRFALEMIATEAARADKFVRGLRLDIQGLVRAFRSATHVDALRLAVDLSLQERANSSKVASRGLALGQKRKAE
ncbi:gag protease polyprotein [Cucumis melo var. makuwa]|uniref:Gag protease polyprotein n=1 Tax=Cucumis melo var. makuwa TaxID=1194695 RepID=A0A5A7V1H9_CUCMM|nr:gag protease polyprotein [Cucumis melo var. makuwa]TYK06242.1 gag protease polyprotein [Cucumis melo var. makuwa]